MLMMRDTSALAIWRGVPVHSERVRDLGAIDKRTRGALVVHPTHVWGLAVTRVAGK
jgi:hypothetical protein